MKMGSKPESHSSRWVPSTDAVISTAVPYVPAPPPDGGVIGGAMEASPLVVWGRMPGTVDSLALGFIAAAYRGFAVADRRHRVIPAEAGVP
jgi:hypothetical protein